MKRTLFACATLFLLAALQSAALPEDEKVRVMYYMEGVGHVSCDVPDPQTCTVPLPVTLGGSCSIAGPAGAVCTYPCVGGEIQHVRAHNQWGLFSNVAVRGECGGATAYCASGPGCTGDSPTRAQGLGTWQGVCTLLTDETFASCSSGAAAVPPDPPQWPHFAWTSATGGTLSWTPPAFDGRSAVTQYTIYVGTTPVVVGATTGTSFPLAGLDPDRLSAYRVTASNAVGEGAGAWIEIQGNTACDTRSVCSIHCVPGAVLRVYAYDGEGQLEGNLIEGAVACGDAATGCSGLNSCQSVSTPNAQPPAYGTCTAVAPATYVACAAGNVPVMPGPPAGTQAQLVRQCPYSDSWHRTCTTITWAPPAFDGGGPIDGYRVYRENWCCTAYAGTLEGQYPSRTCGPTCLMDTVGCTPGDIGHPLRYWVVALRDEREGPPSNVATTLPC